MTVTTELLERADELATVRRALDAVEAGAGRLLMVEGEAGAGKTSLLAAAAEMGAEREMLVLRARGGEHERDFAYGVARQLFEPVLADESRRGELLQGMAAAVAPIFSPKPPQSESGPFAVQHGLYWLVADLAEGAPLLLLVDDAQWADLASLRALVYVARRLEGVPVALVVAIRTGETGPADPLLDELRREPGVTPIVPEPLTEEAASLLADSELGQSPTPKFAAACHRVSSGNPFLIVELLRALAAERVAPSDENADRLEGLAAAGVSRSILARLGRLGDRAVEIARVVSILEPSAEVEHVAALAGIGVEEAAEASSRLIAARLLADRRPLTFVHPLVRSAVYTDMPEPTRAQLHAEAAKRLAAVGGSADSITGHLMLAPPAADPAVVKALRAAAREASSVGAPEAAVELLRRAIAEPPPDDEQFAVRRQLGLAELMASDIRGIETLMRLHAGSDDKVARGEIAAVLSPSLTYRGRGEETATLLKQSLRELDGSEPRLEMRLRAELLEQALLGGRSMVDDISERVDEAWPGDSIEGRRLLELSSFMEAIGFGRIDRAEHLAGGAIQDVDTVREDAKLGLPPTRALLALVLADRADEVEWVYPVVFEAARTRNVNAVAAAFGTRSYGRTLDGDLIQGLADAERAAQLARPFDITVFAAIWSAAEAWAMTERGELDAARQLMLRDLPAGGAEPGFFGALILRARARLQSALGEHEAARRSLLGVAERVEFLPFANPEIVGWHPELARTETLLGNRREAARLAAEGVRIAQEAGGARGVGIALAAQGVVAGSEGVEILRESVETLSGTRARLEHARALIDLGAALRRANHRKEAREPLREGLDIAHRLGARPLEDRARTELEATGARPRGAVLSGVDSLTPSEVRVARMAVEGMTNREIAQGLFVTAKTVETHLRHVYQKLGISRRTELGAALALERAAG
jgi:DNA-binding CsgD family transcriptional regulator